MPNPITNYKNSIGIDLGNILITKEYLMTVYPQIANQLITPELWVWGINSSGRLGTFSSTSTLTPVTTLAGGANWKQVSCGFNVNSAIKTDGTLWTWGGNSNGEIGDNTLTARCTPVTTFAGGTNWKQVDCNYQHTASIKTDGTLWLWGASQFQNFGHLGINSSTRICTPVTTFSGGTNWKQVSCGYYHTAAIKTDGTLWLWGQGSSGQLGHNAASDSLTPITTFAGGTNWKQVASGSQHTAAIKTDGTLWVWGNNGFGQLGINLAQGRTTPVTTFAGGSNWKQVSSKNNNTVAIKTDGTLWTWGNNDAGQLGINNTTSPICTPVTTFAGATNWKQVASSARSLTAAIKTDGTLWVWGNGLSYALGINDTNNMLTPVTTFAGGTNWKQIACGYSTSAIKTSDDILGI